MSELDDIRKRTEGHTPGPWSIEGHGMADALYSRRDDQHHGLNLCTLSDWDMNGRANARLIAAAPDLLRIATKQEAELTQLRTERDRLKVALDHASHDLDPEDNAIIWQILHPDQVDAALTRREGWEDD